MPDRGKLTEQITFRVQKQIANRLRAIIKKERRKDAEVQRALLERGMAAYERDGLLFEPQQDSTLDSDQ